MQLAAVQSGGRRTWKGFPFLMAAVSSCSVLTSCA